MDARTHAHAAVAPQRQPHVKNKNPARLPHSLVLRSLRAINPVEAREPAINNGRRCLCYPAPALAWPSSGLDVPHKVLEHLDDVLEAVHVVAEDEPVAEVAIGRAVRHVAVLAWHQFATHVLAQDDAALGQGHLQLAQHLKQEQGTLDYSRRLATPPAAYSPTTPPHLRTARHSYA
jgi:hypothetical protein